MKRIHLFEFEDFPWFPAWLRTCLTRYIQVIHKILDSAANIAKLLDGLLNHGESPVIIDLCSGSGGPMIQAQNILRSNYGYRDLQLVLTDAHPDPDSIKYFQSQNDTTLQYLPHAVDATQTDLQAGIRTMICGLHHFDPQAARKVLKNAQDSAQPLLVYEISDNSFPKWLWWIAIPLNIITVLFLTPLVRPMSWQQLVFTYLIPILPLIIAWDGAVSNARTYTLNDLDILLSEIRKPDYHWHHGSIPGKGGSKLFLVGAPKHTV